MVAKRKDFDAQTLLFVPFSTSDNFITVVKGRPSLTPRLILSLSLEVAFSLSYLFDLIVTAWLVGNWGFRNPVPIELVCLSIFGVKLEVNW